MGLIDDLFGEAKRGVASFRRRSREAADHARLRLEKAGLQREQEKLFKRLGQDLYKLHRQGIAVPESLQGPLGDIERLEAEIHRKQEVLQRMLATEPGASLEAGEPDAAEPTHGEER